MKQFHFLSLVVISFLSNYLHNEFNIIFQKESLTDEFIKFSALYRLHILYQSIDSFVYQFLAQGSNFQMYIIIMIGSIKSFINSKFTPSEKDFQTKGVLSPQQFIQAGDQLTNFGWKWQQSLNNKKSKLLENQKKQYLMAMASSITRINKITSQNIKESEKKNQYGFIQIDGEDNIQQNQEDFRKYTIYISYDEYYHTPRLWIKGNDINGIPLNSKQLFEDIYSQYHNQTVTQQTMPFLDCRMLTIHPCKHSDVLKKFIQQSKAKGKKIKPHQSLIIFLKFMSSVMPTIRYDQTVDIQI